MGIRCNHLLSLVLAPAIVLFGAAPAAYSQTPAPAAPASSAPQPSAPPQAQTAPPAATPPPAADPAPLSTAKPVAPPPDANGGKGASWPFFSRAGHISGASTKEKKVKPPPMLPMTVDRGVLTVDGWTGKADLNFQIPDFKFAYIWIPGVGTAVVSHDFFPGSKLQTDAFDGNTLTVKVEGHTVQLTSERPLLAAKHKKPVPEGAYVAFDTTYRDPSLFPVFGYGKTGVAPFSWPGSLADLKRNPDAPPLPSGIKPKTEVVKLCQKNSDGTDVACRVVDVPMTAGKSKS